MNAEMLSLIIKEGLKNYNGKIDEETIKNIVLTTEKNLNKELSGYGKKDKPYKQWYSENIWNADFPRQRVAKAIIDTANNQRKSIAFRCETNYTYGRLADEIVKYAYILKTKYKIKKGDIIAMNLLSTPQAICSFFGANLIGATVRPIEPISSPKEVDRIIKETGAKTLICNDINYINLKDIALNNNMKVSYLSLNNFLPLVSPFKKQVFNLLSKINQHKIKTDKKNNWYLYDEDIKNLNTEDIKLNEIEEPFSKNETALIIPTSGTTGTPKGVEITNENLISNAIKEYNSDFDIKNGDSLFNPMPSSSSFFWYVVILTTKLGLTTSLSPLFDANKSTKQIYSDNSNWILLGPIIIEQLVNYIENGSKTIDKYDNANEIIKKLMKIDNIKQNIQTLKSKKHYISGGDRLSFDLLTKAEKEGLEINDNLGTSENGGPSVNPNGVRENNLGYYKGSVGTILPGNNMAIFAWNEDINQPDFESSDFNKGMPYYHIGEICFSADNPNVFKGYYKNPEETDRVKIKHSDGSIWYHSGDLGYLDPAGHLFCSSRKSGLIVRDGHKVWIPKIENIGNSIPGIKECSVVGVEDKKEKEVPFCFVVYDDGINENQKNIINKEFGQKIKESLNEKHVPIFYKDIKHLPRNLMGKVKISELVSMAKEEQTNNKTIRKVKKLGSIFRKLEKE